LNRKNILKIRNLKVIKCINAKQGQCVCVADIHHWYRPNEIAVPVVRAQFAQWTFLESGNGISKENMRQAVTRLVTLAGASDIIEYLKLMEAQIK
jgi:hypothetical protein